jgi:hypothetical protein
LLRDVCSGVRAAVQVMSQSLSLKTVEWLFRFPRRPLLLLLVFLLIWKYEGLNWTCSVTMTSCLVRCKLKAFVEIVVGDGKCTFTAYGADLVICNDYLSRLLRLWELRFLRQWPSPERWVTSTMTRGVASGTFVGLFKSRNENAVSSRSDWYDECFLWCPSFYYVVWLGGGVRLRSQSKLTVQHLLVSENSGKG